MAVRDQVAIDNGYLYLLQEKQKKNKKLLNEAKKQIKFIDVEIEEEVVEEIEGIKFNEAEGGVIEIVNIDDVEVLEEEVADDEDDGDEDELKGEIVANIE